MNKTKGILWVSMASFLILASCSKVDGPGGQETCAVCNVVEKTNILISGNLDISDFTESTQNDPAVDLVDYKYYGDPSTAFEFIIQLQSGWKLMIELIDQNEGNPWEQVGISFNAYPGKDLDEIARYARITMTKGGEHPGFTTNPGSGVHPITQFGVFRVSSLTPALIQGQIRGLRLYKIGSPGVTVTIDGSILGAATFL